MNFPAYPEYKDSSVEWLDEVPAHWIESKVKYALIRVVAGGTPESGKSEYWSDVGKGTPWVAISDMTKGSLVNSTEKEISQLGLKSKGLEVLPKGSLIYSIYASLGKVATLGVGAVTNQAILGLVVNSHISDVGFLRWWMVSVERWIKAYSSSNTQENLNAEKVGNLPVLFPSIYEQRVIATFLDHETARIDALIAEQQRLIALLKEKRQAVISHAVTKGLDPDAPMKDSGVEWLGDVPAHWEVVPLGLLARQIQTGPFGSQLHSYEYVEGGVPVINPSSIVDGKILPDPSSTVTQEVADRLVHQRLFEGEVVVGRRGEMGRCAAVSSEESGWLCGTGSMKIALSERLDPDFVSMFIRTPLIRGLLQIESVGSTMDNLNPEILSRVRVPVPPIEEQQYLVEKIKLAEGGAQRLISEALQGSELLQERRSALISAAVTGKIDVRGWQAGRQAEPEDTLMAAEPWATYQ